MDSLTSIAELENRIELLEKWKVGIDFQVGRLVSDHESEKRIRETAHTNLHQKLGSIETESRISRDSILERVDLKLQVFGKDIKDELVSKHAENKEFGAKRDEKLDKLQLRVDDLQHKMFFAAGVIAALQFVAPYIVSLIKSLP